MPRVRLVAGAGGGAHRAPELTVAVAPLSRALALGARLGANGSLVGASANVVAVGIAERRDEPIGFWRFARIGPPFAVGSLVAASLHLWLRSLAF